MSTPSGPKDKRKTGMIWAPRSFCAALGLSLIASCASAPRYVDPRGHLVPRGASRQDIVQYAKSFVGTPYRPGGASRRGVDCSGLVMTVYAEFEIDLPRTSLDQSRVGSDVDRSRLRAGDLVFFKTSRKRPVSHVGIYIGNGKFVHASTSARRVRIDDLENVYFKRRYVAAKQVIGD